VSQAVVRRGIKEYRASEALSLIAADRARALLVCPSCGARAIERVPRRHPEGQNAPVEERVSLTCRRCGRHASYIERGPGQPRDAAVDPSAP
jgi:predicted RNA-binding Zn-ribbon protein involved in translation (DUF1610 family)